MSEVKITIEGEGLSLTKFTTLQKAGQIISFLGVDQGAEATPERAASSIPLLRTRLQPKDAIFKSGAKTYAQKIAALAAYLHDELQQETFSPNELRNLFKKIGDEPKNFSRDFKEALERQYVLCVDASADQYQLTDRGDEAAKNGFTDEVPKKKAGGAKRPHTSKNIRDEVKALEINASMEGYPNYHSLPTKGDKILWLLQYAHSLGIKALSPTEVEYISTELNERIESKGFTALNARNVRGAFVIKSTEGYRVQKKGSDYLQALESKKSD